MKKKVVKKVVKKVEKEKTLEELDRGIKWIKTEWRTDHSAARTFVKKDKRANPGSIYKVNKIPDKGFCVIIFGRKKEDYENVCMGREWPV